jgi:hypothetical protein
MKNEMKAGQIEEAQTMAQSCMNSAYQEGVNS